MIRHLKQFLTTLWTAIVERYRELREGLKRHPIDARDSGVLVMIDARTPDEQRFVRELSRLFEKNQSGDPLDVNQLDYWADRYNQLNISARAGVSFKAYLQRPELVEEIAQTTMPRADRDPVTDSQ